MKKISTVQVLGNEILKPTIGVDLGDRWSFYCVLDEAGKIILEQKVATTPEAMKQTFAKIPRSLIALETGTHSPWASRLLTELGHEVLVAHAQKVELITKSNRKDDRHDARTLARLARIDPELLGPVRRRSAQAQIHLTVIRARAELVRFLAPVIEQAGVFEIPAECVANLLNEFTSLRLARLEDYNSGTALPGLSLRTICEGETDAKRLPHVHFLLCLLECDSRAIRQTR
jgi:hypothetical protein